MKIAVVGSYGVGMTMRFAKFPEAGETLMGGAFDAGPGGKGSNQAIGAARLLELPLLTEEEREIAVEISMEAGASLLGTSAGIEIISDTSTSFTKSY